MPETPIHNEQILNEHLQEFFAVNDLQMLVMDYFEKERILTDGIYVFRLQNYIELLYFDPTSGQAKFISFRNHSLENHLVVKWFQLMQKNESKEKQNKQERYRIDSNGIWCGRYQYTNDERVTVTLPSILSAGESFSFSLKIEKDGNLLREQNFSCYSFHLC